MTRSEAEPRPEAARKRRRSGLLWATILWTGCGVDLSVRDNAEIACSNDRDCPRDYTCHPVLQRCFGKGVLDTEAPRVEGLAIVQPDVGRAGTEMTVEFSVSEQLLEAPVVSFAGPSGQVALSPASAFAPEQRRFTFTHTATGEEAEGRNPLRVELVDENGNRSAGMLGASLELDFTAPDILPESLTVDLLPDPAGNPLRSVRAARDGTLVRLAFTVTEPLASGFDPQVELALEPPVLFSAVSSGGLTYLFEWTAGASAADGAHAVTVLLEDRAGNEGRVELDARVAVDNTPPQPPAVTAPGRIVYERTPWGRAATEGGLEAPSSAVVGAPGAVEVCPGDEPCRHVIAFTLDGDELGRVAADPATGAFGPLQLMPPDRARIQLASVDEAGNASAGVEPRDGLWTAGFATFADAGDNPHRLYGLRDVTPALASRPEDTFRPATAETARVARADADPLVVEMRRNWHLLAASPAVPRGLTHAAAAFDSARGRLVLFGGVAGPTVGATWEWDGERWLLAPPAGMQPFARAEAAMAYDAGRRETILFGGRSAVPDCSGEGTSACNDIWRWDGSSWLDVTPVTGNPPPRSAAALAYDAARRRLVLFGGTRQPPDTDPYCCQLGSCVAGDTWEWDGTAWIEVQLADPEGDGNPSPRAGHVLAYDPQRRRMALFGGSAARPVSACFPPPPTTAMSDVWEYDGKSWRRMTESSAHPMVDGAGAYVATEQGIVLFGGCGHAAAAAWGQWGAAVCGEDGLPCFRELSWPQGQPAWRAGHVMAHDPLANSLLLFGGFTEESSPHPLPPSCSGPFSLASDLWELTGGVWARAAAEAGEPPPRSGHAMLYDSSMERVWLFGGYDLGAYRGDTWTWTDGSWTQEMPTLGDPPPRRYAGAAYDEANDIVLLFGGVDRDLVYGDTWQWSTSAGWTPTANSAVEPPPRQLPAMAYHPLEQVVLMFGGSTGEDPGTRLGDTWGHGAWGAPDCSDIAAPCWQLLDTGGAAAPSARDGAVATYDSLLDAVVIFGGRAADPATCSSTGSGLCDDAWAWGRFGEAVCGGPEPCWQEITAPANPQGGRAAHGFAFDAERGRRVLFGGMGGYASRGVWEWDGAQWRDVTEDASSIGHREHMGMVMHAKRRSMIVFGGHVEEQTTGDMWELTADSAAAPGVRLELSWAASGRALGEVTKLHVEVVARGLGFNTTNPGQGDAVHEVQLLGWDFVEQHWRPLAQRVGAELGALDYASASADEAQSLISTLGDITLLVRPEAGMGNGAAPGGVEIDLAEVVVEYRLQ